MSVVWIITDEKQGHYHQSLGLALALQRKQPDLLIETLPVFSKYQLLRMLLGLPLSDLCPSTVNTHEPALIIAAGHATHLSVLTLGWRFKSKTLLLMSPSLPVSCFDLCFIPAHDQPKASDHIIVTQGALNPMRPAVKQKNTGLILIGGPSKHHGWDESELFAQLEPLIASESLHWTVTSSRRTPQSTMDKLAKLNSVTFIPHTKTPQGWLAEKLAVTEVAWVSSDSVSMIYEALTAGCQVGVLAVPEMKRNRLTQGIQALAQEGTITLFSQWLETQQLGSICVFNEADRCAELILKRGWL